MASILIPPQIQFIDYNGEPLINGKVYTYEAGTTTPKLSWKDQDEISFNTNPVILDDSGRAEIWINGAYKIIINNADDELIYTADNVISYSDADFSGLTATIADLNTTAAEAEIFFNDQSPTLNDRSKIFLMNAASISLNVNLPSIVSLGTADSKYRITIKKIDKSNNLVSILPNGIQTIDGRNSYILYDYNDFVELIADGSNWNVISSQIRDTIITLSADFAVELGDNGRHFNCNTSSVTVNANLPSISTVAKGFTVSFKKIDIANSVIINADAPDLIDGNTEIVIGLENEAYTLKSDGTNWYIIGEFIAVGSSGFTTGDVKITFKTSQIGWVRMDDGSIGSALSGATTRANEDTKDLFILLYLSISDSWALVSGGRSGTTELDAINDFNANKTLTLPRSLGRVLGNYGNGTGLTNKEFGSYGGLEFVALTVKELPIHYHQYYRSPIYIADQDSGIDNMRNIESLQNSLNANDGVGNFANNDPHPNIQPSIFMNFLIKL